MSPEKKKKLLIQAFFRFCLILGLIAGFFLYQSLKEGDFSSTSLKAESIKEKLKNIFLSSGGTTFEFKPETGLFKEIKETGKITYKSGKVSTFENSYKAFEKRSFSNNILTLEGKTEGDFDPVLKPLMKDGTYSQKIDTSTSYCPEDFVPHYPSALRNYVYFMPRTPLFDGKTWDIFSCGQSFLCSYSVSMKDHENKIDFGCSGKIGETHSTLVGSAVINGSFNGFSSIEMTIVSENNDLSSSWSFEEKNSFMPKISK
jgi:hypothetical protein